MSEEHSDSIDCGGPSNSAAKGTEGSAAAPPQLISSLDDLFFKETAAAGNHTS